MTRTCAADDAALPPNRRAFVGSGLVLTFAALAAATASEPVAAAKHPDAEILALGAELDRLEADLGHFRSAYNDGVPGAEEPYESRADAQREVTEQIASTEARTLAGYAVKARALSYIYEGDFAPRALNLGQTTDHLLIWSILSGLVKKQQGLGLVVRT